MTSNLIKINSNELKLIHFKVAQPGLFGPFPAYNKYISKHRFDADVSKKGNYRPIPT